MEGLPRCPICYELIREPVVLPCLHEMCRECFQRCMETANFYCPICRKRYSSWARQHAKDPIDGKRKRELDVIFEQFDSVETLELLLRLKDEEEENSRRGALDSNEGQVTADLEELERLGEVAALQLQDEEEKTRMAEIEEDERLAKELSQQLQHEHQVTMQTQLEEDRRVAEWLDRVFNNKRKVSSAKPSSKTITTMHHTRMKKSHRCSSSSNPASPTSNTMSFKPLSMWFKPCLQPTVEGSGRALSTTNCLKGLGSS